MRVPRIIRLPASEWMIILALIGVGLGLWALSAQREGWRLHAPDAMEYAAVARNILHGKGLMTNSISPSVLALPRGNEFMDVIHSLLHPYVMAGVFALLGATDGTAIFSSGLFYVLGGVALYLLARTMFGTMVAIIAAGLYLANLEMLYYSASGLSEPLFILLLVLSLCAFHTTRSWQGMLVAGLLLGLARLARINAILFVPAYLLALTLDEPGRRWRNALWLLAGFTIAGLPELYRGMIVAGNPLLSVFVTGVASGTDLYPGYTLNRSMTRVSGLEFIWQFPGIFLRKYTENLLGYYGGLLSLTKPLLMIMFVVNVFRRYEDTLITRTRLVIYAAMVLQLLVLSAGVVRIRYFHIFIPFVILFGMEQLVFLVNGLHLRKRWSRVAIIASLAVVLLGPSVFVIGKGVRTRGEEHTARYAWVKELLSRHTRPDDVIVSDIPWAVGWYADRRAIWFPVDVKGLEGIERHGIKVAGILLTSIGARVDEETSDWGRILQAQPKSFGEFELVDTFKNAHISALLYKRRA